jgi:hypothetical protein
MFDFEGLSGDVKETRRLERQEYLQKIAQEKQEYLQKTAQERQECLQKIAREKQEGRQKTAQERQKCLQKAAQEGQQKIAQERKDIADYLRIQGLSDALTNCALNAQSKQQAGLLLSPPSQE